MNVTRYPNLVVISAFRNMSGRIHNYLTQVGHLMWGFNPRVVAVEGDSTDDTRDQLIAISGLKGIDLDLVTHNHGLRVFGSTEHADRLQALTGVLMAGMSRVRSDDEVVLYVESDLLWDFPTIQAIHKLLRPGIRDIVAPLTFAGDNFYDIWGFRKNGTRFSPFPPYHPDIASDPAPLTPSMDSVGSCLMFRSEIARRVTPVGEEALVSWCHGARNLGYKIVASMKHRIHHP